MTAPNSKPYIRLYRYFKAEWALRTLETGKLRVSRLSELNDPFEFVPALPFVHPSFPHEIVDKELEFLRQEFGGKLGVICLSERIDDPVMWSHYADGHKGIALGFDLWDDDQLFAMHYPETRPTVDVQQFPKMTEMEGLKMMRRILSAKAPSWSYERERRVFVDFASATQENGHYFHQIPPDCLKIVVLGMRCSTTEVEVRAALQKGRLDDGVEIVRARRCPTHFRVLH